MSDLEIRPATPDDIPAIVAMLADDPLGAQRESPDDLTPYISLFPVGKTIYAHYLIKGKQVALQSFGRAPAPCGVLTVRRPLFPGTAQHRSYPLQIDTSRPLVENTVTVLNGKARVGLLTGCVQSVVR